MEGENAVNKCPDPVVEEKIRNPAALLDMLAEVASATLKNDPMIQVKGKKVDKGTGKRRETLDLDQIRMLSDKLLVNMFAEPSADEMRRNYSYTCFLMPDRCRQKYCSFGNENRARQLMKTHLLNHVAELLAQINSGRSERPNFTAESVQARKRRLAGSGHGSNKRNKRGGVKPVKTKAPRGRRPKRGDPGTRKRLDCIARLAEEIGIGGPDSDVETEAKGIKQQRAPFSPFSSSSSSSSWSSSSSSSSSSFAGAVRKGEGEDEEAEQPLHDHCYTMVEGHQSRMDTEDNPGEDVEPKKEEEEVEEDEEEPLSPDTEPLKRSSDLSDLDEEDPQSYECGDAEKGSAEWERKLALKWIRFLRTKKKDERVALICKICKDKTFTAMATLMYHYRSHAGIKPFVCNVCNTTFTRQHSLNYHMLIHGNQSRFTCADCGRKFRHPSHFKEHLRRHTGETPFECSDCGLRFKTRNTYKRHLKTRHGKLLTMNGILVLTAEEFQKVKTTPKRKAFRWKDKETQWPEGTSGASEVPAQNAEDSHARQVWTRVLSIVDDGREKEESE